MIAQYFSASSPKVPVTKLTASPSALTVMEDSGKPRTGTPPLVTLKRARKAIGLSGAPTSVLLGFGRGSRSSMTALDH